MMTKALPKKLSSLCCQKYHGYQDICEIRINISLGSYTHTHLDHNDVKLEGKIRVQDAHKTY